MLFRSLDIDDFKQLKDSNLRLPNLVPGLGKMAYRGKMLGHSQMEGSQPQDIIFNSALRLFKIIFYHGFAFDGMEFVYDDNTRQLFGKRGGKEGGDIFEIGSYHPAMHLRTRNSNVFS